MKLSKILILIILVFLAFEIIFIHPTFSDDNFYFNVGNEVSKGKRPYIDFFFAHPPLQIYILASIFKVFGSSYVVGKIYSLMISICCVLIVYLIAKKLYDKKIAFVSSLLFLITPTFISFSSIGYGMWETVLFVLLSTYLLLEDKPVTSAISFTVSIFFRYVAIFYLPFLILLYYTRKKKIVNFILPLLITSLFSFIFLFLIFGKNYFDQTILFHIFSKIQTTHRAQYWGIGLFSYFLALVSAFILYLEKDRIAFLFALTTLIVDPMILLIFKLTFYHYFLISLPFCMIATGRALSFKHSDARIVLITIFVLSLILNFQTIDFYINPIHSKNFYSVINFVEENVSKEEKIFGEPVMTNYVSFETGRMIAGNYFDSYLPHLIFEGENQVIKKLEVDKPKIIIELESYYLSNPAFRDFILSNYRIVKSFKGVLSYSVYILK